MRIALAIQKLQPRGGLEDNCLRIAAELERRGHEVTLFTAAKDDISFRHVLLRPPALSITNHGRARAFARSFAAESRGHFDRTVVFQPVPGADVLFLADVLRNRADAPLAKRITPRFRTYTALEEGCFGSQANTRIIGLANPQMRAFAERYPASRERTVIIPPTLPASRRRTDLREPGTRLAARARFGLDDDAVVWLWLGLQPTVKGLDRVVEALAHSPNAVLLVGGLTSGDDKSRRDAARATRLGVGDRIRWLGYIADDEYFEAIAAADLLAHPARVDVTGGVILEAIINGLPVVATDVCGFSPHIERSGAGRVVPSPFDRDAFVAALNAVAEEDRAALSARGIAYGADPLLYSGIEVACDLIEAAEWPPSGNGL